MQLTSTGTGSLPFSDGTGWTMVRNSTGTETKIHVLMHSSISLFPMMVGQAFP
ncbi:hypothetical protein BDR07DRAFT_816730 [Suillus spraguei]|nr:hypothetical protein BDR07DRAFT_816730 [Suillus spraguei]